MLLYNHYTVMIMRYNYYYFTTRVEITPLRLRPAGALLAGVVAAQLAVPAVLSS